MKISDIQNVLILARQGIKVFAENVDADQGAQAFSSISEVEKWVQMLIEQHKKQEESAASTGEKVEVVEVNQEEIGE